MAAGGGILAGLDSLKVERVLGDETLRFGEFHA